MDNVVVIQPIFAIDDITYDLQTKSLLSFYEYLKKNKTTNLQVLFGGYCTKEKYWEVIYDLVAQLNHKFKDNNSFKLYRYEKNYGKAFIVNFLYNNYADKNSKWLFTYDSDMRYCDDDIFNRLINTANQLNNSLIKTVLLNSKVVPKFGLFALNQLDDSCHLGFELNADKNILNVNNEVIEYHNSGDGIAGGSLFISTDAWKVINGYRCTAIYGGDDGHCIGDMQRNGYTVTLIKSIGMIHPKKHHVNWTYETWKRNSLKSNESVYGVELNKEELENRINEYENIVERNVN